MKTTIDIPDPVLDEIKDLARARRTTFRELVLEGLRLVLRERQRGFRLADASVSGKGVQPGIREGDWDLLRDLSYEGRGT